MRNFTISYNFDLDPKSPPTPAATCCFFFRKAIAAALVAGGWLRSQLHLRNLGTKVECHGVHLESTCWQSIVQVVWSKGQNHGNAQVVATVFLFPPSQLWKWISQQSYHFWMSIPRSIFQSSKTSSTLSCYISLISQQISQSFCMPSWCSQHGRSFSLGREAIDVLSSLQC